MSATGDQHVYAADAFWRAANYLTAVVLYLKDNVLLQQPLRAEHFKERIVGHWGTCPGVSFIYTHLSAFVKTQGQRTLLVVGPGHAGPAVLACLFLEGTLHTYYPHLTRNAAGLQRLATTFGAPGGFETEISAHYPGMLYAGGELGPALALAQGIAFDQPDTLVSVIIGDGEAETAMTAASWLAGAYLNPLSSGMVLPILHLNGFRMGGRSLFSQFSQTRLAHYFAGLGYQPLFVAGAHEQMHTALHLARSIFQQRQQAAARGMALPAAPLIVLQTPKGWTAPQFLNGQPVEGNVASHKVPLSGKRTAEDIAAIERWLRHYQPEELFNEAGEPREETLAILPSPSLQPGRSLQRLQEERTALRLPPLSSFALPVESLHSPAEHLACYLHALIGTDGQQQFRLFSPDELSSNRLDGLLRMGESQGQSPEERILEILSEHVCQGWLQGYVLSGRVGILATYEAFASVVSSLLGQYLKFLAESRQIVWRPTLPTLILFLTSLGWRNVFTHQNPDLIDAILARRLPFARIYYPLDAHHLLVALKQSLGSVNGLALLVASKYPQRILCDLATAEQQMRSGLCLLKDCPGGAPDVVLCAIGDWLAEECLMGLGLLQRFVPSLRVRLVAVTELTALGTPTLYSHAPDDHAFTICFTAAQPVLVCFGGFAAAIESLLLRRPAPTRFHVLGYWDGGGNQTAFSMLIRHSLDRFSLAKGVLALACESGQTIACAEKDGLYHYIDDVYQKYDQYLKEHGADPTWIWREGGARA